MRRSRTSARATRAGTERPARVGRRQRELDEQVGQRARRAAALGRRAEHDLAGPRRRRRRTRPGARPSRRPGRPCSSGRRPATAATSAASSPSARRSSADGGSPAPTRIAVTDLSRSIADIASGSVVSALPDTVRQPLREAVATQRRRARARRRRRRPACGARAGDLEARQVAGAAAAQVEGGRQLGVGGDGPVAEDADRPPRRRRRPAGPASRPVASDRRRARSGPRRWWRRPHRGRGRRGARSSPGHATRPAPPACSGMRRHGAGRARVRRPRRSLRRSPRAGR